MLGRPDVRLVDSNGTVIAIAPTATDLFAAGENTYLDLPGNPLNPGCSYEKWAREIAVGTPTTAYAHVVTEPGSRASSRSSTGSTTRSTTSTTSTSRTGR